MPTFYKSKKCLICSEAYKVVVSLDQLWCELETLTIAKVLQNLHFLNFSNVETIGGALCFICSHKLHSCCQLKTKCDRIEKQLTTTVTKTINDWSTVPPLVPLSLKNKNREIQKSNIFADTNLKGICNGTTTRDCISTPTTIDCSNVIKSEIDIDEGIFGKEPETLQSLINGGSLCAKKFTCPICQKSFEFKCRLRQHYLIHTAEKTHVCNVCNKSFLYLQSFQRHNMLHAGEKSHVCDVCNKSFVLARTLMLHKLTHTTEKAYACDVCNKSFAKQYNLKRHKMIHTGKKPYVCDVCHRSYIHYNTLKQHKKIHSGGQPHVCDVCNKSFVLLGNLNMHKLIHSDDKPYGCDVCSRSFAHRSNLTRHKMIHSDEKPLPCDVCKKKFFCVKTLKKHKRIQHDLILE